MPALGIDVAHGQVDQRDHQVVLRDFHAPRDGLVKEFAPGDVGGDQQHHDDYAENASGNAYFFYEIQKSTSNLHTCSHLLQPSFFLEISVVLGKVKYSC